MKLTIKAMIRWEQLSGRPFSSLDYTNEEDILSLFYVCGEMDQTLADFKKHVEDSEMQKHIDKFQHYTEVSNQFVQAVAKKKNKR